jgi:hypothetical protein
MASTWPKTTRGGQTDLFRTPLHNLEAFKSRIKERNDRHQQPNTRTVVPAVDSDKLCVRINTEESHIMGCSEECVFQVRELLLLVVGEARDSNPVLQRVRYVSRKSQRVFLNTALANPSAVSAHPYALVIQDTTSSTRSSRRTSRGR